MQYRPFKLSLACVCLVVAGVVPSLIAGKKDKVVAGVNEQKRAIHALNRLTFGPRPGDVQQVMANGVERWIDQQLHPEKMPDNGIESRLASLRTLRMTSKEIVEEFPNPQM